MELDTQIRAVKRTLDGMLARQREICTQINIYHDPITTRLPTEIIATIFQQTVVQDFNVLGCAAFHSDPELRAGPLVLGSVCRLWRRIAWSSPKLWSTIRIYLDLHPEDTDPVGVARDWLSRSSQLPLSIRISSWARNGYEPQETDIGTALISLVNSHSSRWHEFEVDAPNWAIRQLCDGLRNAPRLHTLRKSCADDLEELVLVDSPTFRPTHIEFYEHSLESLGVDWSYVTHLTVGFFSEDACLELFRRATQLVDCHLALIANNRGEFPIPTEPIISPSVRSLKIEGIAGPAFLGNIRATGGVVISNLILPSLNHLESCKIDAAELIEFVTRSSCPLTSIKISGSDFDQTSMQSLFCKTPSLQKMKLMEGYTRDHPSHSRSFCTRVFPQTIPKFEDSDTSHDANTTTEEDYLTKLQAIEVVGSMSEEDDDEFWGVIPGTWNIIGPYRRNCQVQQ